jgi:hypothetical protein
VFQSASQSGTNLNFTWSAQAGFSYQVQYTTNLGSPHWVNLQSPVTASGSTVSFSTAIGPDPQRFYQILFVPCTALVIPAAALVFHETHLVDLCPPDSGNDPCL